MDKIYDMMNENISIHIGGIHMELNMYKVIWPCTALSVLYFLFWKECSFNNVRKVKKLSKQRPSHQNNDDIPYEAKVVNIPVIKGWFCEVYRKLSRTFVGTRLLAASSKKMAELDVFQRMMLPEKPTYYPIMFPKLNTIKQLDNAIDDISSLIKPTDSGDEFRFNTISDYVIGYKNGSITPLQVAKNVIAAIKHSETMSPKLRIIVEFHEEDILKRADEATQRWKEEKPLSVFDGIPIAVKDEIFLAGYPCCAGTDIKEFREFICSTNEEGRMVSKLREGGAIFIGIANMHQLGMGVTGINSCNSYGTCRNPYNNESYPCGGSSSGPAAAVACGFCPIALGADAGGSIRIPSSVCGIVGAKNTFGRISATGFRRDCDTVFHAGPLCATVQDARIAYGFLAGPDDDYHEGAMQPPPYLSLTGLADGIRCGIDWNYFNDCSAEIRESCMASVDYLVKHHGAEIIDISIPELQEVVRAHCLTILVEMYTHGEEIYEEKHNDLLAETEVNLMFGKAFSAMDYFKAQQQRTRIMTILTRLFKTVDCIITPTCGNFVPKLDPDMLKYGLMDMKLTTEIMRYSVLGNFAGNPSISVPVGYSSIGLPIGILIQTEWWKEDLMYKIAGAMEKSLKPRRKPGIYYDVIGNCESDALNDKETSLKC